MKKLIIVYIVLIVAVILLAIVRGGGDLLSFLPFGGKTATASINEKTIEIELADDDQERQRGLSGRDNLGENSGMLFLFDKKDKYGFWMKEMRFPIDIIYLDDNKVVHIVENAPSSAQAPNLTIYTPDEPANRVLELNAGKAKEFGIEEGSEIEFSNL